MNGSKAAPIPWKLILAGSGLIVVVYSIVAVPIYLDRCAVDGIEWKGGKVIYGYPDRSGIPGDGTEEVIEVELYHSKLDYDAVTHLAQFNHLTTLFLRGTELTDGGIAGFNRLANLKLLGLNQTNVTDDDMQSICTLRKLECLDVGGTSITDEGLKKLESLPTLEALLLEDTKISDDGLQHLSRMKNLRHVFLRNTRVTDDGVRMLQASLPDCVIIR